MRKFLGIFAGIRLPLLHAAVLLLLFSGAICKAQGPCDPDKGPEPEPGLPQPTITSISPSATLTPGHSYNLLVTGNFPGNSPRSQVPGCDYTEFLIVTSSSFYLNFGAAVGDSDPYVTVNNFYDPNAYISPTQVMISVTVAPNAPTETDYLIIKCDNCDLNAYTPIQIAASGPTITTITPAAWWAGQKQEITITGTGFLTSGEAGGPSQVAATAAGVRLSNVHVVSATQITATVNLSKDATTETATITATNPPSSATPGTGSGTAQVYALPVITDTSRLQDAIMSVNLSAPSGTTGELIPVLHGTVASGTAIDSGPDIPSLAPGQQDVDLDFDFVIPAVYTRADGNWYPLVPPAASPLTLQIRPYTFPTSWTYFRKIFYTQYNIPHESSCAGTDSDAWIVSASVAKGKTVCNFTPIKLNSDFIAAVWINGTGIDNGGDILKNAAGLKLGDAQRCAGQYPAGAIGHTPQKVSPRGDIANGNGNTFVIVSPPITGSCNETLIPDQSLAVPSSVLSGVKELSCNDLLSLDSGDHALAYTRTAADLCPACSKASPFFDQSSPMYGADGHIDAFSPNVSCTGRGVGSLGFFYTSYPTN